MTITTTQKIIKIGTSKGVTLPARELKKLGTKVGSEVQVKLELVNQPHMKLIDEYEEFKAQYCNALKNLANR